MKKVLKAELNNMIAYVGLGNPGSLYSKTKHNSGFWVVDEWAKRHKLSFESGKGDYIIAQHKRREVIVIKPTLGMNRSGEVVRAIAEKWDLLPPDIYIIVDDVDLPLGTVRIKPKGGDGCHRGMENIIYQLNSNNFPRLRLGIATNENMRPSEEYVLKPFKTEYELEVKEMIQKGVDSLDSLLIQGLNYSMNKYNS